MNHYTGPLDVDGLIPRHIFEEMMQLHDIACALSGLSLPPLSQKYGGPRPPDVDTWALIEAGAARGAAKGAKP